MDYEYIKYKKELDNQKNRVRKIRETLDSLTDVMVYHLNKINRTLTELEKTLSKHPKIEEVYINTS